MPREEDRATAMDNKCKNSVKIGRVVPKIRSRTDKHTQKNKQTDIDVTILRSSIGGGVKSEYDEVR